VKAEDDEELRAIVKSAVAAGSSTADIARQLGMSDRNVQRIRAALGIPGQVLRPISEDERRRIRLFMEDECPINEIARTMGRSVKAIHDHAAKDGIPTGHTEGENLIDCRRLREELGLLNY
jgi:DNA invertase Pin-like site-specific DNA recombinase